MLDFGLLPPEINSGRMYSGPGPGPMLLAAAAWRDLATNLHSAAASYRSVLSRLAAAWSGPSSATMMSAAAPYCSWIDATAALAEDTSDHAKAAAAAYETAFVATVAPPVIAANRAQLAALIATNILGQNTPAIMATEAQYSEMWAQDAAAMYTYAAHSSAAAQVPSFDPAPQTTTPAAATAPTGAAAQTTAMAPTALSATTQALGSLVVQPSAVTAAAPTSLLSALDSVITGPLGPASVFGIGGSPYLLGVENYLIPQNAANLNSALTRIARDQSTLGRYLLGPDAGSPLPGAAGSPGGTLSARVADSEVIGRLSVPQSWASAAPAVRPVASVLSEVNLSVTPAALAADGQGSLYNNAALSALAGRAMTGTGGSSVRTVGSGGLVAAGEATTATIIVIPEDG